MLSIIIPSYNEPYLVDTLKSILNNAQGEIEIYVNVDDGNEIKFKDKRVKFNYPKSPLGMRAGINKALQETKGDYIMKCDAHCVFAPSFDAIILDTIKANWLVVPRRYSLYAEGWRRDTRFPPKDYHYLIYPRHDKFVGLATYPLEWKEMQKQRRNVSIDDTMTMQGSCYIANRKFFMEKVGLLNNQEYGSFGGEQIEVGLKYWLKGGEIKVNKNTWYAHLFKNSRYYKEIGGNNARKHKINVKSKGGWENLTRHFMQNKEPNIIHPFDWIIDKFSPVPTWPEDRSLWQLT